MFKLMPAPELLFFPCVCLLMHRLTETHGERNNSERQRRREKEKKLNSNGAESDVGTAFKAAMHKDLPGHEDTVT